jgi:hypothetical protein
MTTHWWQQPRIQAWAWQLWRYYSWRPGYQLTLTTAFPTAYVDMKNQRVVCNPEYPMPPQPEAQEVRDLPWDTRAFQLRYLESLIAHEAGHTHFSGALPPGLLGQLVNSIEDERMERLMARDFKELGALFGFAADVDAAHAVHASGQGGDVLYGCLFHRFTCRHPVWAFQPDGPDAVHWPEVRAVLEAAWDAPVYADVIVAAEWILNRLGVPKEAPKRDDLQRFLDVSLDGLPEIPEAEQEKGSGGNGAGVGREKRPPLPVLDALPSPAAVKLMTTTAGYAQEMAPLLHPPVQPGRVHASRDRGRFRYDRYQRGAERVFEQRVELTRPGPMHVRVAVDISGSMEGERLETARFLTFALRQAAQLAGVPMLAFGFDDETHALIEPETLFQTGLNRIAALTVCGGTTLAPTLKALWQPVLAGHSLTFIITDGSLSSQDYRACQALRAGHTGLVVPILLVDAPSILQAYQDAFGQCVSAAELPSLLPKVLAFLRALRA